MASGHHHHQEAGRAPRGPNLRAEAAPLQTQNLRQNHPSRFSWEMPAPSQRPVYEQFASPTNSSIDESPLTATTYQPMSSPTDVRQQFASYPEEKVSPNRIRSPHNPSQTHNVHPAHFAPYADEHSSQRYSASMPMHDLPPQRPKSPYSEHNRQTSVPLPQDTSSDQKTAISTPRMTPRTPTYNPHSLTGPNENLENHLPGQISHPNAVVDPSWKHGMCEMDTLCCTSLFCPCIVYGKTQYRLGQKSQKKEPTDLLGYKNANSSCSLLAVACGFQWLLASVQRTRIRKAYHLTGSLGDDCLKGLCCCCCVLAQNEREVHEREQLLRQNAGPINTAVAYSSQSGGMVYAPPPR